jgi:hypothetical protein
MITLFKKAGDEFSEEIHSALDDLIIRFEFKNLPADSAEPSYIRDGEKIVKGEKEIIDWLRQLEAELKWQRSLSGDGCYIDPETGNTC